MHKTLPLLNIKRQSVTQTKIESEYVFSAIQLVDRKFLISHWACSAVLSVEDLVQVNDFKLSYRKVLKLIGKVSAS